MPQPSVDASGQSSSGDAARGLRPLPPPRRNKVLLAVSAGALAAWLAFLAYLAFAT